jgi:uncharacterized repeat protein (TIGR01451 family)/LPXTG-motif cell wall-anchored protein
MGTRARSQRRGWRVGATIAIATAALGATAPGVAQAGNGNELDSTVSVTKIVLPVTTPNWSIPFTISPDPDGAGGQPATKNATTAQPTVSWNIDSSDGPFTISEVLPTGWATNDTPGCYDDTDGPSRAPHQRPRQGASPTETSFDPGPDSTWVCEFRNLAAPRVTIQKATRGGVGVPFQFEVSNGLEPLDRVVYGSPSITTTVEDTFQPAVPASVEVPVDTVLQVEEMVPPGWQYVDAQCTKYGAGGSAESTYNGIPMVDPPSLAAGQELRCQVSNEKLVTVSVTKTVVGGGPWAFDFELLTPKQSPGQGVILTATNQNPTVTFTNVSPDAIYAVFEYPQENYAEGTMVCTGDSPEPVGPNRAVHRAPRGGGLSFPGPYDIIFVRAGDEVVCNITNTDTRVTDLQIIKTPDVLETTLDATVVWSLEVKNISTVAAANVEVNDTLPSELDLVSVTPPAGWDCSGSGNGTPAVVNCSKPSMAPGETAIISVATQVATLLGEEIVNTAHVGTATTELTLANNSSTARVFAGELPATGSTSPTRPLLIGSVLAGLGGLALVGTRRRRTRSA